MASNAIYIRVDTEISTNALFVERMKYKGLGVTEFMLICFSQSFNSMCFFKELLLTCPIWYSK